MNVSKMPGFTAENVFKARAHYRTASVFDFSKPYVQPATMNNACRHLLAAILLSPEGSAAEFALVIAYQYSGCGRFAVG